MPKMNFPTVPLLKADQECARLRQLTHLQNMFWLVLSVQLPGRGGNQACNKAQNVLFGRIINEI